MKSETVNNSVGPDYFFTIVIPVYNRAWCVGRAVASAVEFLGNCDETGEIVLVDDGSSDDSVLVVEKLVNEHGGSCAFRFLQHERNRGVCAAKNSGALIARGEWVIFLDSDDELVASAAKEVVAALNSSATYPLHFFACATETEKIVYSSNSFRLGSINTLLTSGTGGEALPVIRSDIFRECPYDEDIRGYESLSYLRILRDAKYFVLHTSVARRYYILHADRLSTPAGMKARTRDLRTGHIRVLSEHWRVLAPRALLKQVLRIVKATVWGY